MSRCRPASCRQSARPKFLHCHEQAPLPKKALRVEEASLADSTTPSPRSVLTRGVSVIRNMTGHYETDTTGQPKFRDTKPIRESPPRRLRAPGMHRVMRKRTRTSHETDTEGPTRVQSACVLDEMQVK